MTDPIPPAPSKPRAKRGLVDQALEDALALATKCAREAAKAEVAPKLAEREWTAADLDLLTASQDRAEELAQRIQTARTGKLTRTDEEEAARTTLISALDPILKGARRTYGEGSAERAAYGIGQSVANKSTFNLLTLARYADAQLAPGEGGAAPKDKLKGVLASEIAAITQLVRGYESANWAQADAQKSAAELLALLKKEINETLLPLVRDLQGAADQAYTHRDPLNAAQRQAFKLQPDRPFTA